MAQRAFSKPARLQYHHVSDASTLCSFPRFASPAACDDLISLCEKVGFKAEQADSYYTQATFDLEVDTSPRVRQWLIQHELVAAVSRCMRSSHGVAPEVFDDVFVVKYDATVPGGQQGLEWHYDAGNVSFMLALSARDSYTGGGTAFDVLQEGYSESSQRYNQDVDMTQGRGDGSPLHLEQGELLLFEAQLFHSGLPISSGLRYLLVGFCFTRPCVCNGCDGSRSDDIEVSRGDVGLDLQPLHTPRGLSGSGSSE
jgi:hypothetical protein